jgi:hypothetical protein
MNKKMQFAIGIALVGLFVASFAAIAPKAVKAAIATLVRDQDNAARRPFSAQCFSTGSTGNSVNCSTPTIPAGEEVVIESISFQGFASASNSVLVPQVITFESGVQNTFNPNPMTDSGFFQPSAAFFQGGQTVRLYADPGSVITCAGVTRGANPVGVGLVVDCFFSGYSVTLP